MEWNILHKHGIERTLRVESKIQYVPLTNYYEPSHIQYIPVRQQFCDIIEVYLCEENDKNATFETGKTTVTLHFKQYGHKRNRGDITQQ